MQAIFLTKLLKENMHKTKRLRYRSNLKRMPIYRARSGARTRARTRSRTRQYFPFLPVSTKTINNMNGNFPCFLYSSSTKGRPIIAFQCLQTKSQIAGFLTCSLFTFFNTRQKYWTPTEKDLRNTQTSHLTSLGRLRIVEMSGPCNH